MSKRACILNLQAKTYCIIFGLSASVAFNTAQAQDSAFLACSSYSDREQRVACLESALDTALNNAGRTISTLPAKDLPSVNKNTKQTIITTQSFKDNTQTLPERVRDFGTKESASIAVDDNGNDELHDTIASLSKRNNMWIIKLTSGQLWKQVVPDRLNLREEDEIRIYRAGFGNSFRLEAKRLSGFIRVERTN